MSLNDVLSYFSLTRTPARISLRENERQQLLKFLELNLSHKDMLVGHHASYPSNPELSDFRFISINGAEVISANSFYQQLHFLLNHRNVSAAAALATLENFFAKPQSSKRKTIVLVDETDYLMTLDDGIVYNLLNWFSSRGFVLLLIANSLSDNSTLYPRIQSRLGPHRIRFVDYTKAELKSIIIDRFRSAGVDDYTVLFDEKH
ncbi:hypothetical protein GEMRC1_007915 [Eukaryota sp. GEM-RC1]